MFRPWVWAVLRQRSLCGRLVPGPWVLMGFAMRTVGKAADGEHAVVLGQVCQRHIGRALANHEVDRDETLEDDGPCRVAQPVLHGAKDFGHARLSRMRRDENVLNVFGFWRRILLLSV